MSDAFQPTAFQPTAFQAIGGAVVGRPTTIEEKIETALLTRALALDLDGDPPIAWPGEPFDPPPGPYIQALHFRNVNSRPFVGSTAPHLRQGILQLTVVMPVAHMRTTGVGLSMVTALAGEIAEHFPADLALYEDGVRVRIQQAPDVVTADKNDVSQDVAVSVRYESFC